jgi:hypothetical protein
MNAHQDLLELFQEWRTLTETEGQAIRSATWPEVNRCQDAKFHLQSRLMMAHESLQAERLARGLDPVTYDPPYRQVVAELIRLEQRNSEWLADQYQQAERQNQDLARTSRNLRQVHRAYAPGAPAHWHSYS